VTRRRFLQEDISCRFNVHVATEVFFVELQHVTQESSSSLGTNYGEEPKKRG
jgi:hypothetical protein